MRQVFQSSLDSHGQGSINALIDRVPASSHCLGNLADGLASLVPEKDFGPDHFPKRLSARVRYRFNPVEIIQIDPQSCTSRFTCHLARKPTIHSLSTESRNEVLAPSIAGSWPTSNRGR